MALWASLCTFGYCRVYRINPLCWGYQGLLLSAKVNFILTTCRFTHQWAIGKKSTCRVETALVLTHCKDPGHTHLTPLAKVMGWERFVSYTLHISSLVYATKGWRMASTVSSTLTLMLPKTCNQAIDAVSASVLASLYHPSKKTWTRGNHLLRVH